MTIKAEIFAQLTLPSQELDLAKAGLLLACYLAPPFEISMYLNQLNQISGQAQAEMPATDTPQDRLEALNRVLFAQGNFRGNAEDYYNPDNSFLNKVLDTGLGIPITLSVIYLEVAWRLALPVAGIGLPGHFIVAYQDDETAIYIDPFNRGRFLSEDDCMDMCQVPEADRLPFRKEYLKPVSKRDILFRMLLNLKHIYVSQENWDQAYKTVDLMLAIKPTQVTETRDRGLIAYRLNRYQDAIFDIQQYLIQAPNSPDAQWLKQYLNTIETKLLHLN